VRRSPSRRSPRPKNSSRRCPRRRRLRRILHTTTTGRRTVACNNRPSTGITCGSNPYRRRRRRPSKCLRIKIDRVRLTRVKYNIHIVLIGIWFLTNTCFFQQVPTVGEAKVRSARDQRDGTAILALGHQVRPETRTAPQRCQSGAHSSGQATVVVIVVVFVGNGSGRSGSATRR